MTQVGKNGFPVIFIGRRPVRVGDVDRETSDRMMEELDRCCRVVSQEELPAALDGLGIVTARLERRDRFLTVYHYENGGEIYLLLNEDPGKSFCQWVTLPETPAGKKLLRYDAWENRILPVAEKEDNGKKAVYVNLAPLEMMVLAEAAADWLTAAACGRGIQPSEKTERAEMELTCFNVSRCEALCYPDFKEPEAADLQNGMALRHPDFSGFYRYETSFPAEHLKDAVLKLEDVYESAEVFLNGKSVGMRTAQPYRYELGDLDGEVFLAIEVATTLERKAHAIGADTSCMSTPAPMAPTGIVGKVVISGGITKI